MSKSQRVFRDKDKLKTLKELRKKGYTYHSLAFLYSVDFSSIYHHVKGVTPQSHLVLNLSNLLSCFQVDTSDILSLLDLHVKQQKSYEDYLRENEQKRRFPNILRLTGKV